MRSSAVAKSKEKKHLPGMVAPSTMLAVLDRLEEYYTRRSELDDPTQLVNFGSSGHRGSPLRGTFTEAHVLTITQAICDYRESHGIDGPLYLDKDTQTVCGPAQSSALEAFAANGVATVIQQDDGFTPTPVASRTEDFYKIYAESFLDRAHLNAIVEGPREIVDNAVAER
jgi:phosphoglucomutase